MRSLLVVVTIAHGLVHLIGFAKAFHLARIEALHSEIGRTAGLAWLGAALGLFVASGLLAASSRSWPFVAIPALVVSQALVVTTWSDAKAGSIANVILLAAAVVALVERSPTSLRSTYEREIARGLSRDAGMELVRDDDLASLPTQLQTYLRRAGVVGKPHVHDARIVWRAQMRRAPGDAWMPLQVEQHSFFDDPTRLFFMEGKMYGVPFVGLHHYAEGKATMDVRVASLLRIVDGKGPKMDQSETVTMFNDMCVFAPAALLRARVAWEVVDRQCVRGTYTNGASTVSAKLYFDEAGDLVDFVSFDRYESADGKTYRRYRWSTPLSDYREFGGHRVAARGEATWRYPDGDFVYGRFEIEAIDYNVGGELSRRPASERPVGTGAQSTAGSFATPTRYGF